MADGSRATPKTPDTTALKKALVKAMVRHSEQSSIDGNVRNAFYTLTKALYNVLACRPFSRFTNVDESTLTNLNAPDRLKDLDTINAMVQAYLELLKASEPFEDVFAGILSEFQGKAGEGLGQFMTPPDLAKLVAALTTATGPHKDYSAMRAIVASGEPIRIGDPTGCGTGGLLLAVLGQMHAEAPDLLEHVEVMGVDIDADMMRATTVQIVWNCFFHRAPVRKAEFYRANVLTEYTTMRPAFVFFGGVA